MNLELIVFDLDGTLVDSVPDIAGACNTVLQAEGLPLFPVDEFRQCIGWGLRKTFECVIPDYVSPENKERISSRIIDEYQKRPAKKSRVYAGIHELLAYLTQESVVMIVYTNKPICLAIPVIETLFPGNPFDAVLGYTERFPHKPDPSALQEYLQDKHVPLSSILMIGDTPVDLETARNATVSFAGASWGFRSEMVLREAGSDLIFSRPADVHRWLQLKKDVKNDTE